MKKNACIIILCGPSGSGKSTIREKLLNNLKPQPKIIKTLTTRKKRVSDHKNAYTYISKKRFFYLLENKKIAEFNFYNKHYYATRTNDFEKIIKNNLVAIKEMDINTARKIKKLYPKNSMIFYINCPTENLRQRLLKRKENSNIDIKKRLLIADKETKLKIYADYIIENPQNFPEQAAFEIIKIVNKKNNI